MEYAKDEDDPDAIYIRITSYNRGPDPATLHVIPHLWFRNTWAWPAGQVTIPSLTGSKTGGESDYIVARHPEMSKFYMYCLPSPPPVGPDGDFTGDADDGITPELLFTDNDTNFRRLYGGDNGRKCTKDAFHDHIIPSHRPSDCKNDNFVYENKKGTKSAAHYTFRDVPAGGCAVVRLKLTHLSPSKDPNFDDEGLFDDVVEERREEADEFYNGLSMGLISDDLKQIMRQALGGMLWTKQFYQFVHKEWMEGDPAQPPPPPSRKYIRNRDWRHMHAEDILSMPDK